MGLHLLRAADRAPAPWKNGGGVTTEVAIFPAGAGLDDFQWRISTADIVADGPFSSFPDVDRTLIMLEGGIRLAVAGGIPVELTRASPPHAFAGDQAASAQLMTPAARDLNVMVRRGRWRAEALRFELSGQQALRLEADETLLFVETGEVNLSSPRLTLGPLDAALVCPSAGRDLMLSSRGATAYLVSLSAL